MTLEVSPLNPSATKPKKRRKKGRKGQPNALQIDITPTDGAEWGPAMKALRTDKHRAFVLALYQVKPGYGAHVKAAKLAGFGTSTSSAQSWSVIATRLAGDDKIQAAMYEEDQRRLRATAPRAISALGRLIENPRHKDHARAIAMTLDRVHPAETRHVVDVTHHREDEFDAIEARTLNMLKGLGTPVAGLITYFGYNGYAWAENRVRAAAKKSGTPLAESDDEFEARIKRAYAEYNLIPRDQLDAMRVVAGGQLSNDRPPPRQGGPLIEGEVVNEALGAAPIPQTAPEPAPASPAPSPDPMSELERLRPRPRRD